MKNHDYNIIPAVGMMGWDGYKKGSLTMRRGGGNEDVREEDGGCARFH